MLVKRMAYIPKTLVIGRCTRCGKKIYKGDTAYKCPNCGILICPTCYKKVFGKCPICQTELVEI